ncbi:MAG TPA: hypothetical protein VII75_16825 [Thermoanaerobaculia bacterium]
MCHGGAKLDSGADFSITPVDETTVRIRCLHAKCEVGTEKLAKNETAEVALDSDVSLTLR